MSVVTLLSGSSVTGRRNSPVLSAPTIGGSCGRGSTTPTIPGTSTGTSWTTAQAGATLTDTFSGSGTSSQRTRGCTGESDCSSSVVMLSLSRCYIEGGDERDFKEIQFQPKFPLDSNSNGIDC